MPLQRLVLIANPRAGRSGRHLLERLCALLDPALPTTVAWTSHPGHATTLAATHGRDPDTLVAVVGGDGSLNEALQGLPADGTLGLVPAGTANVAARELGIPLDPLAAGKLLLTGAVIRLDVGLITPCRSVARDRFEPVAGRPPRRFLIMAGIGFDAHVAARVPALTKRVLRKYAYHLQSAWEFIGYRAPRLRVVDQDGVVHRGAFAQFANLRRYGGDLFFAPAARGDDGVLDLALVRDLRWPTLLAVVVAARHGSGLPARLAETTRLTAATVSSPDGPLEYQLDGEVFPPETALRLAVAPGALRMVVP